MDKVNEALNIIKLGAKMSEHYYQAPLLICNSGGKDSLVILALAKMAGINYEVQHSLTTVDAPETMKYVRKQMHELELQGVPVEIRKPTYKGERTSMMQLIPLKGPPTRIKRYCCSILKEAAGNHRAIATGLRADESRNRAERTEIESVTGRRNEGEHLNFEDAADLFEKDINRQAVEHDEAFLRSCRVKGKTAINPIINWSSADVWDFIHAEKLEYNPLYDMGFSRVGCIGCPMARCKDRQKEFSIWPQYERAYKAAFQRFLDKCQERGKPDLWGGNLDAMWHWWMEDGIITGQQTLWEDENNGSD